MVYLYENRLVRARIRLQLGAIRRQPTDMGLPLAARPGNITFQKLRVVRRTQRRELFHLCQVDDHGLLLVRRWQPVNSVAGSVRPDGGPRCEAFRLDEPVEVLRRRGAMHDKVTDVQRPQP